MKRDVEKELLAWKDQRERTPLIIRGARQVGKSYTVEQFGANSFQNTVVVNFEENPKASSCFASLDVHSIVRQLEYLYGQKMILGETLLFLDEIQNCPQAIKSLRYFKEKLPKLHVIAAGSLLEFVLEDEEKPLSFPVGRVRFLTMRPLSFREFLWALGEEQWDEFFEAVEPHQIIAEGLHQQLLDFVRDYFLIGGMPAAVSAYLESRSYLEALRTQRSLLDFYRLDLAKYGQKKEFAHLQRLFESAPQFVGKHFRYSKIDPESANPSRDYKNALRKLNQAHVVSSVHATAANGIPLKAEENVKKFKLLFLDIGLLQCALEVEPSLFSANPFHQVNAGVLAEQFTGQELLSYVDPFIEAHLFFWETEKYGSAEVDYLMNYFGKVIPIEVKAGKSGRLASLQQFMKIKNSLLGIHISVNQLTYENHVLTVPFYLIKEIPRLIKALI